jgi:hypothetical protein
MTSPATRRSAIPWVGAGSPPARALAAVQATHPAAVALRNLALWTLGHLPPLQRPLLARAAGLRS